MNCDILFSEFEIKSLKIRNRFVMAPMSRFKSSNGIIAQESIDYYAKRASGGVGLVLTEGATIGRHGASNDQMAPRFFGEEALCQWQKIVKAVQAEGACIAPQLWHTGAVTGIRDRRTADQIDSPSGLERSGVIKGVAMDDWAIADTIEAFTQAAIDAERLGFNAIELHAAHGYLIDQFFWSETNRRADRFGGELISDRVNFALELVKSIRSAVQDTFTIIVRISQWKMQDYGAKIVETPNELESWLGPLAAAGVDLFHCSQRDFCVPEFPDCDGSSGLNLAGWAKKVTGCATISVGSVFMDFSSDSRIGKEFASSPRLLNLVSRMENGEFDLIALGRPLISDPSLVNKMLSNNLGDIIPFEERMLESLI